jgi:hypothetical protein
VVYGGDSRKNPISKLHVHQSFITTNFLDRLQVVEVRSTNCVHANGLLLILSTVYRLFCEKTGLREYFPSLC